MTKIDPNATRIVCGYCGHDDGAKEQKPKHTPQDRDYRQALESLLAERIAKSPPIPPMLECQCSRCGAPIRISLNESKPHCPYCGSEVKTLETPPHQERVPIDGIIAAKLSSSQAQGGLKKWLSRQYWMQIGESKKLLDSLPHLTHLTYWTFDARVEVRYRGAVGTMSESTVERGTQIVKRREIHWASLSDTFEHQFDDVLVPGNQAWLPEILTSLEPWDLENLESFDPEEPAFAKSLTLPYDVELDLAFESFKTREEERLRREVADRIKGQRTRIDDVIYKWENIRYKRILLPVYMAGSQLKNRDYQVLIQAINGKVAGDVPLSATKIIIALVLGWLGISALLNAII